MLFTVASSLEYPPLAVVYDRFAALAQLLPKPPSSPAPSGLLVVNGRLNREGVAVALGSNLAGAALLCMEPESLLAKQAMRSGICDAMVRDVGEAIELLEQERGKPRPFSVIVLGEPEVVTLEIAERGLAPSFVHLYDDGRPIPGTQALLARGARPLPLQLPYDGMAAVSWTVAREPQRWLPLTDALAAGALDPRQLNTAQRRRWIEASPTLPGRTYPAQRFLPMTPSEADAFTAAVQRDVEGGVIQVAVRISRNGQEQLLAS
jgi:hypothetical protein